MAGTATGRWGTALVKLITVDYNATQTAMTPTPTSTVTKTPSPSGTPVPSPTVNLCIALDSIIDPFPTITRNTFQFTELPFSIYETTVYTVWGFGYNAGYIRDVLGGDRSQLKNTGYVHSGIDFVFGDQVRTVLSWTGNKKAIYWGDKAVDFGAGPHNITLECDGFYIIYGHVSDQNKHLTIGQEIEEGTPIGVSGENEFGSDHLHLEIRPIKYNSRPVGEDGKLFDATVYEGKKFYNETKGCYVNPLTFVSDSLFYAWKDNFESSDYIKPNSSLLGYKQYGVGNCYMGE